MEQKIEKAPSYFNEKIEALRGIGALIVILDHWAFLYPEPLSRMIYRLNPSVAGIAVFFLISGFYITDMLLRARDRNEKNWLQKFYIRRAFRMLPVYYLAIIVFSVLLKEMRNVWEIHAFFLGNFYPFMTNEGISIGDHLWSVGAELHFYILWPLFLLYVPEKYYKHLALCVILIGPLTRYLILRIYLGGHHSLGVFTTVVFDWIGLGALFAFLIREGRTAIVNILLKVLAVLAPVCTVLYLYSFLNFRKTVWFTTIEYLLTACIFGFFVLRAVTGKNGWIEKIYARPLLIKLGTVSYTFYILHPFIPEVVEQYITKPLGIAEEYKIIAISSVLLISFTFLIYYFVEVPFRNWGKKLI